MNQLPLLRGPHLPSVFRYETLFSHLPALPQQEDAKRGRKAYDHNILLRALIYRCLRQIPTLTELTFELENNPTLADCLGLDPVKKLPSIERFSAFLRDTDNSVLQAIRLAMVKELIKEEVISGRVLALDSCSVVAPLRENNLKTRVSHLRFDKNKPPSGDPETGVGIRVHFTGESKQKVTYFWGYRNHTVSDAESELTLWEETHPANVSEVRRAIPMLQEVKQWSLPIAFVAADSEYDVEDILSFVVEQLQAQPIIAHNPRNEKNTSYRIEGSQVYCAANLPMAHRGTCTSSGRTYRQYGCALHWLKKYQRQYLLCPIGHPKHLQQKGCNVLIRLTPSLRTQIPYGSQLFSQIYNKRTAIERSYSRLLTITMQHPTVHGLTANKNHCTIAHIATLLVASTAASMGEKDKIRWIKSFVPNLLKN
jgi:transposase